MCLIVLKIITLNTKYLFHFFPVNCFFFSFLWLSLTWTCFLKIHYTFFFFHDNLFSLALSSWIRRLFMTIQYGMFHLIKQAGAWDWYCYRCVFIYSFAFMLSLMHQIYKQRYLYLSHTFIANTYKKDIIKWRKTGKIS